MKKNTMMRIASVLMVAVLLSTCAISSTFAKYVTTNGSSDEARIARWGVKITAGAGAFANEYESDTQAFTGKTVIGVQAQGATIKSVVAPGTSGNFEGFSITGTPEVATNVSVTADLVLTGWETTDTYCPLVFTFGSGESAKVYKIGANDQNGNTIEKVTQLEQAVEHEFTSLSKPVNANDSVDCGCGFTWSWPIGSNDINDEIHKNDTALGNLLDAPTISFSCTATVTQVD